MNGNPRVFLVDDQPAVLKSLSRLLKSANFDVAVFNSAQEFMESGNAAEAGCVVLDLSMPGMDGLAMQQMLSLSASVLPIIFLTGHGDIDSSVQAMKRGASDFLTKPVDGDLLISAIRVAIEKNLQARREGAERADLELRLASLTPREREVLLLVVEGKLNKQVGDALNMAEKTVKIHRARAMAKMQAHSLADLVRMAEKAGIRIVE